MIKTFYILLCLSLPTLYLPGPAISNEMDEEPMPNITGQVTFLYYTDLASASNFESAAEFYGGVLGLEVAHDLGWARLYAVSDTATVGIVKDGSGYHAATNGEKPVMLSIITDDVDGWFARLQEAGVTILSPLKPLETKLKSGNSPDRAPVRGFLVEDPGGYTVEIFTWL